MHQVFRFGTNQIFLMDFSSVFLVLLGYVIGIVGFPLSDRAFDSVVKFATPGYKDNRSQAIVMLAALAQLSVIGFVVAVPLQVFGFIPLLERAPYFAWSLLLGNFTFGVWKWLKFRRVTQADKSAEIDRKARLAESIEVEIAERHREQKQKNDEVSKQ